MRVSKWLLITVFAAAVLLRLGDSLRPVDGASWRESDMASIARNYAVEGMNPLYPRIDWRGAGPGYVEMELPITPWLTALLYRFLGIHDVFGRLWSLIFSIGTLLIFYRLSREYLSQLGAFVAFAFFAFNPLILDASSAFQPEAAMMLAYISAVYLFLKWLKSDKDVDLIAAAAVTALAVLAKATAGHIGLMFGILMLQKYGVGVFSKYKVWLFGALSVIPAAAWYVHAKYFWLTYGNSLGVSNEYHWAGPDFLTNPYFATGILRTEILSVCLVFGLAVIIFGLIYGPASDIRKWSLLWLASIFVMYIAAARTTADDWASYYHIFSVPPAALLFGIGIERVKEQAITWANNFSRHELIWNLSRVVILLVVIGAAGATFVAEAVIARKSVVEHRIKDADFQFAKSIGPMLEHDGLVLVSGGPCFDDDGYHVAYNKSYMFYALERKGSNICVEDQSVEKVMSFAAAGYSYFVAQRLETDKRPGLESALESLFPVTARNNEYTVFALRRDVR